MFLDETHLKNSNTLDFEDVTLYVTEEELRNLYYRVKSVENITEDLV